MAAATAVVLEGDWPLVEEPLEGHVQRGVVRGLAAQHHALAHCHLHPTRAQLHAHGICKHKAAALSPQASTMDEPEQGFSTGGVLGNTLSCREKFFDKRAASVAFGRLCVYTVRKHTQKKLRKKKTMDN